MRNNKMFLIFCFIKILFVYLPRKINLKAKMTKKELEEIHEILTDMVEGLYMDEVDIFESMWRWAKEKYHEQGPNKLGELYNEDL